MLVVTSILGTVILHVHFLQWPQLHKGWRRTFLKFVEDWSYELVLLVVVSLGQLQSILWQSVVMSHCFLFVAAQLGSMFWPTWLRCDPCRSEIASAMVATMFCHSFWVEEVAEMLRSFDTASAKSPVSTTKVFYSGGRDTYTSTTVCGSTQAGTNSGGAWIFGGIFWWWRMCDHDEWKRKDLFISEPKHRRCTGPSVVSWQVGRWSFKAQKWHRVAKGLLELAGLQLHNATCRTSAESHAIDEAKRASDSSRWSAWESRSI